MEVASVLHQSNFFDINARNYLYGNTRKSVIYKAMDEQVDLKGVRNET